MPKQWECNKCNHLNDPEAGDSSLKCGACGSLRSIWIVLAPAALVVALVVAVVLFFIPSGGGGEGAFREKVKAALAGTGDEEGLVTAVEDHELHAFASSNGIANVNANEVINNEKVSFLDAKKLELATRYPDGPPKEEHRQLCAVAKRLDLLSMVTGCKPPIEEINKLLGLGEFQKAKELAAENPDDHEAKRILGMLDMPVDVQVEMQTQKAGAAPSQLYPVDSPQLKNLELSSNDNYRFKVNTKQDGTFAYIFQKDQHGDIKRVFPDPVWSKGVTNPLRSGTPFFIPGDDRKWLYLDELSGSETQIEETIYVVASPWKANDIEDLYGEIHKTTDASERRLRTQDFMKHYQMRKGAALKCVYCTEFTFKHIK